MEASYRWHPRGTTGPPPLIPHFAPIEVLSESLPWEDPRVRKDVRRVYNLRLPEPYLLKLKHISEHTSSSMQQFCLGILLPAIDEKVKELT